MKTNHRTRRAEMQSGFTLIELMIAIGVIAVLTTVAFSSYTSAMARGDRATAISDINEISQALERFYTFNRVYSNDFGDLSMGAANSFSISDPAGLYIYTIGVPNTTTINNVPQSAKNGPSYVIYAKPTAKNRDTWTLTQNDIGFQQHYARSSTTAKTGWP